MLSAILQIILSLIAGVTAYVQLRKEFRKRAAVAKKEAVILLIAFISYAVLTIGLTIYSYFDNKTAQKNLQNNFDTLKTNSIALNRKNTNLENQIEKDNEKLKKIIDTNTVKIISNSADKALKSSQELKITAEKIKEEITGSNTPPALRVDISNKLLTIDLTNKSSLPTYASIIIINYSELEACTLSKNRTIIDKACFELNKAQFLNQTLLPYVDTNIPVPEAPLVLDISTYKLELILYIRKKMFLYEVYVTKNITNNNYKYSAQIRIMQKVKNKFEFYPNKLQVITQKVNWSKEFEYISIQTSELYDKL